MSRKKLSIDSFAPESVGSKDILLENAPLIGTVQFFDGVLVLLPSFIFLMVADFILPSFLSQYSVIIAPIIALLGFSMLIIKPKYMSLFSWLKGKWSYRKRDKNMEKNMNSVNGEPFESFEAVPDDDTRNLTLVSRVFPERRAIELENNDIISMVEFSGSNIDMASTDLKYNIVDSYAKSVSSGIDKDVQFYMPMRPVSLDSTIDLYQNNINSGVDFVDNKEYMEQYLQDRLNWLNNLSDSSSVREQYVVIKVTDSDVYREGLNTSDSTGIESLPGGEVINDIRKGVTGENKIRSKQELRRRKLRELQNRRENIAGVLNVGPGNDYKVVSGRKCVSLIKEFWEGNKIYEDEMKSMESQYPFPVMSEKTGDKL